MTKGGPMETRASKLDALRMKKYYSYFIKQNRMKGLEYLRSKKMCPVEHLFDNYELCDSTWCVKKRGKDIIEDTEISNFDKILNTKELDSEVTINRSGPEIFDPN